jgi:LPPG:FO 2-phospho-L-lactate transferase
MAQLRADTARFSPSNPRWTLAPAPPGRSDLRPCDHWPMRITVLAGGIGAARFLRGLLAVTGPDTATPAEITVIGNTGDDIWLFGLKVCPDLDSVMYTLGGGASDERGWGREDETFVVKEELAAYGAEPTWFGLGDRDLATHLVRSQMLGAGYSLSKVTAALCTRWKLGLELIPMSDDRVETHVVIADAAQPGGRTAIHFLEWWVRHHAAIPALGFVQVGNDSARPAPRVLDAIATADLIILPPSNPVVSIGPIVGVPGIREAITAATAPVIGVSPIVGGAPVRGMADACLSAIGVPTSAAAVAEHYGSRRTGGLLDGWLIDEVDAADLAAIEGHGIRALARPLLMTDLPATAAIATAALTFLPR